MSDPGVSRRVDAALLDGSQVALGERGLERIAILLFIYTDYQPNSARRKMAHHAYSQSMFSDSECVVLVQAATSVGHTSQWRPEPRVVYLSYLNPGAVIANFVFDNQGNGRFQNQHGYHAALFMDFSGRACRAPKQGIYVLWTNGARASQIPPESGKSSLGAKVRPREAPIPTQITQTSSTWWFPNEGSTARNYLGF